MSKVVACSQRVHFQTEDWAILPTYLLSQAAEYVWRSHNLIGDPHVFGTNNSDQRILVVWEGDIPNNVCDLVEELVDLAYDESTKGTE